MTVHSLHCAARHVSRRTVGGRARHRLSKSVLSTARPARAQAEAGSTLTCTVGHTPDGFPRFRVANVIFSAAIVKVSSSLSSPRPLARLLAAGRAPPPRGATPVAAARAPDAPDSTLLLFKPFHLTGLRGDNARTHCIEAVVCGVKAPAHRACGHGPHTPHKNLVTPRRARRAQLSLPARPNGGSHMHTSSSVLLAMADLPQASTSRPHASTGASSFAWQVPPLKARRRRRRRTVSACSDA